MTTKKSLTLLIPKKVLGVKMFAEEESAAPIITVGTNSIDYSNKFAFNKIVREKDFELGSVYNKTIGNINILQIGRITNRA